LSSAQTRSSSCTKARCAKSAIIRSCCHSAGYTGSSINSSTRNRSLEFLRSAQPTESFLISAGEASGEYYGAQLIQALQQLSPEARFFGMGGDKMRVAGCELLVNASEVAVVGLAEVVTHLPAIRRKFKNIVAEAKKRRPRAAVLIDFPDFNLRLARELHGIAIPVFYFISPQVWAWRSGRVNQIRKYVRKMIVIFPFEQEFYRRH